MKKHILLVLFSLLSMCVFSKELNYGATYNIDSVLLDNNKINFTVILKCEENDSRTKNELQSRRNEIESFLVSFSARKAKADFSKSNLNILEKEILWHINDNILTSSRIKAVKIIFPNDKQESKISDYGYKEFKWGMSVEDVEAKCKDLEEEVYNDFTRWKTPEDALSYFYKKEILSYAPHDPNPLDYETGIISEYRSKESDLNFYFINGKLRAVHISTMGNDIYSAVVKKYGKATQVTKAAGSIVYHIAAWKDKGRIIVWEDGIWGLETLEYIDSEWLNPLIEKAMTEYRQKNSVIKSRID